MSLSGTPEAPPPVERKLVADVGRMAGASAVAQLVTVVGGFVLARVLGVQFYGLWKTVQLGVTYTALANLGATQGLSRVCPALVSGGRERLYGRLMGASLAVSWLIGGLLAAGILALAVGTGDPGARVAASALAMLVLIQPFAMHGETALIVEKRFGASARILLGSTLVRVAFSVAAALVAGLAGALAVYVLVYAATAFWMARVVQARLWPAVDMGLWRKACRVGLPITLLSGGELLLTTADKWVVVAAMGAEAMSLYQMAIFPLPFLLLAPFNLRQVVTVDVYDKFGRTESLEECRAVLEKSLLSVALGVPWIIGGIYLGMPWLIDWLLPEYSASIPLVQAHAILVFPVLAMQTAYPIAIVARRRTQALGVLAAITGVATLASLCAVLWLGGGLMTVLGIHAAGWLVAGAWLVRSALRWTGASAREATRVCVAILLPMAGLAVELPLVERAVAGAGFTAHSFAHAAVAGLIHTLLCGPLFLALERCTGAPSYLAGRLLDRLGRR